MVNDVTYATNITTIAVAIYLSLNILLTAY